jgi:hypothetical protein
MKKSIWIVIEQGAGITHKAFNYYADALQFIENLKEQLGYDSFELYEVELV